MLWLAVVPKQEIATRFARPSDVCGVYVPLWLRAFASISSSARSIGLGFAGEMGGSCLLVGAVISFGAHRERGARDAKPQGGRLGLAAVMATLLL
jgi:hypothetical protein